MQNTGRNQIGLTDRQITYCQEVWQAICGDRPIGLDISEASRHSSRTRFVEQRNVVVLGADAFPGIAVDANSRMSTLTCLAHELAHLERFHLGYRRPTEPPDMLLDEAETGLRASFLFGLRRRNREVLIEDARDRLIHWLALHRREDGRDEG